MAQLRYGSQLRYEEKNIKITVRAVRHWNRLPRGVLESPSPAVFMRSPDPALGLAVPVALHCSISSQVSPSSAGCAAPAPEGARREGRPHPKWRPALRGPRPRALRALRPPGARGRARRAALPGRPGGRADRETDGQTERPAGPSGTGAPARRGQVNGDGRAEGEGCRGV